MNSGNFGQDVKDALKRILLKVLQAIGSRKLWVMVFGVLLIIQGWQNGSIEPATAMWGIVTTIGTYAGFTAWEDVAKAR